jgi:hypothetical protein
MVMRYEDLDVYQRAYKAALIIHKSSLEFPKIEQFDFIHDEYHQITKMLHGLRKNWSHTRPKKTSDTLSSDTLKHGAAA